MWSMLTLALGAGLFFSADGCCQAWFPAAVPDRPAGFILFQGPTLYGFNLKVWKESADRFYEDSKLLHSIEPELRSRELPGGGLEYSSQPSPGRHRVVREYAMNGFVYEFSVNYAGEEPPEVSQFLHSIQVRPTQKDSSRIGLIQCSLSLDGLASQVLEHRPWPEQRCPVGGRYHLEPHGSEFVIYCDGDHGLPTGYPRIDQTRVILQSPGRPLARPDL